MQGGNIDGAFDLTDPRVSDHVIAEYCFGQIGTESGSLCAGGEAVQRSEVYPASGLPDQFFIRQAGAGRSGVSAPSDGVDQTCRDGEHYCHWLHGATTAGMIAGSPGQRVVSSVMETQPWSGVAPGAKLITMKVGSGKNGPAFQLDTILNALLETERLVTTPDTEELRANPIVAVNLSNSGMYSNLDNWNPEKTCVPGSAGAKIDAISQRLWAKGVAVVISSGNEGLDGGTTPYTCGKYIVAAGATEIENPVIPTDYSNVLNKAQFHLYAPVGYGEWPSNANTLLTHYAGGGAMTTWGTSYAAPQIAGAFAVLAQKTGSPHTAQEINAIRTALSVTGDHIQGPRTSFNYGGRVINIPRALNAIDETNQ